VTLAVFYPRCLAVVSHWTLLAGVWYPLGSELNLMLGSVLSCKGIMQRRTYLQSHRLACKNARAIPETSQELSSTAPQHTRKQALHSPWFSCLLESLNMLLVAECRTCTQRWTCWPLGKSGSTDHTTAADAGVHSQHLFQDFSLFSVCDT
jgi:hypothetical protein